MPKFSRTVVKKNKLCIHLVSSFHAANIKFTNFMNNFVVGLAFASTRRGLRAVRLVFGIPLFISKTTREKWTRHRTCLVEVSLRRLQKLPFGNLDITFRKKELRVNFWTETCADIVVADRQGCSSNKFQH